MARYWAALLLLGQAVTVPATAPVTYHAQTVWRSASALSVLGTSSMAQCGIACHRAPTCHAWKRNTTTGDCTLWPRAAGGSQTVQETAYGTSTCSPPTASYVVGPNCMFYYQERTTKTIWPNAEARCRDTHPSATMAVPMDEESFQFLKANAANSPNQFNFVGMQYVAARSAYVNVATGQLVPVRAGWFQSGSVPVPPSSQLCLSLFTSGLFLDACEHSHRFLCQVQQ